MNINKEACAATAVLSEKHWAVHSAIRKPLLFLDLQAIPQEHLSVDGH